MSIKFKIVNNTNDTLVKYNKLAILYFSNDKML